MLGEVLTVVAQDLAVLRHHRLQVDGALPQPLEVLQRLAGVVHLQVDALVLVAEKQLAAVAVVAVLDVDDRLARIGELEQQSALHLLELPAVNVEVAGLLIEGEREHPVLPAEVLGEEVVDERDVVVHLPHLEDLVTPLAELQVPVLLFQDVGAFLVLLAETPLVPAILDVTEQLEAQLVGVEAA